jgi:hypothetical protein
MKWYKFMYVYRSFQQEARSVIFEDDATQRQADNVLRLLVVVVADKEKMQLLCVIVAS